ncbi:MAG: hypothetical protein CO014_00895 [Candidatus Tagabacteria bacterium CG_4_8_14_3_um_filter_41_8]|uniref:Uncharacterized protein n=1 Tax=Candidatus Tagabacteria bacterium CG_4_8_14_3_um_filter_41_8 TaxID=1975018 RepID=A0A2M8G985_9BACT|nr:MAG: hypothetical protein CO014_00895 [Candidatus Tagabacteria bacterium CG_4_8_14_3_um_filter_41_8]
MEIEEILKRLEEQGKKLEEIHQSVEKMRKFFLWTLIITAIVIILPLIGLLFVIPQFLDIYTGGNLGLPL